VVAVSLISIGLYWGGYVGSPEEAGAAIGWIFRTEDSGALRLGLSADSLALGLTFLSALMGMAVMALILPKSSELHPARFVLGSLVLTVTGSSVCFLATTPWLFAFGVSLSVIGGAFSFRWHLQKGSSGAEAERFLRERLFSLLLLVVGVAAWSSQGIEVRAGSEGAFSSSLGLLAIAAVYLGVIIQCQALPFIGIHMRGLESSPSLRLFTTQLLPAWSAFALLIRFHKEFLGLGVHAVAGWIGVALAVLSAATGLMQREWRSAVPILASTVSLLSFAALNFVGPGAAFCLLIGGGLGLLGLSLTAEMTEGSAQNPPAALRVPGFLSGAAVSGGIGMASATGFAAWARASIEIPIEFGLVLLAFGALSIQTWRTTWLIIRSQGMPTLPWWKLTLLVLIPFGAMSLVWTGVPIQGITESTGLSLLPMEHPATDGDAGIQSIAILQGILAFGLLIGAWATPLKGDRIQALWQRFPRFVGFVAGGFGFDAAFLGLLKGLIRAGVAVDLTTHQKLWGRWLPHALASSIRTVARPSVATDQKIRHGIDRTASAAADFPGRLAQLIQSGDVQWYLFFAIGCTLALLVHFLVKL
jgi:hypothetical protein